MTCMPVCCICVGHIAPNTAWSCDRRARSSLTQSTNMHHGGQYARCASSCSENDHFTALYRDNCIDQGKWIYLMTTMSMFSCLIKPLGRPLRVKPCTRLMCESSCFLICTFRLSVAVVLLSGVYSVPFKHTWFLLIESRTAEGTLVTGLPLASVPCTSSNLHQMQTGQV